ncbi:MAG: glycolate oxidase subunit GlcF [Myxococcota bacterium]|nr:glycolate oxidase subunit GlcF [Myxococcota bacterium]
MQTQLDATILATPAGREAEAILRSCVHCGFCTATCPTYQLLGDELDGPRGRIYLIKQVLEGHTPTRRTQRHLDRCLTCRACETTCPSGVRYARLLDIGRAEVDQRVTRPGWQRLLRGLLVRTVPYPARFKPLLRLAQALRPWLPRSLRSRVPPPQAPSPWPRGRHARRVLVLQGCVQAVATPATNAAAARLFDRLGITPDPIAGCCGALAHHLGDAEQARAQMRRMIDACWPHIADGAEAVVVTASGCAAVLREYGMLLADDHHYAYKAEQLAARVRDPVEVLEGEDLTALGQPGLGRRIAFHAPCTLQHGLRLAGRVEGLLTRLGFALTPVADAHLCCGSAGAYSLLEPSIAQRLRTDKLKALTSGAPELIATANVGCQLYLQAATRLPVVHWLELLHGQWEATSALPRGLR